MVADQACQGITEEVEHLRARIQGGREPGMSPATRYVALILIGTLARLLASEIDSQLLSQSLSNGLGGFIG